MMPNTPTATRTALKPVFTRRRVLGLFAGLSLLAMLAETRVESNDEIVASLSHSLGTPIDSREILWGPRGGAGNDLLLGRWVYFLARTPNEQGDAFRDLYRARVRVAPNGRVFSLGAVYNLTRTSLGDEHTLSISGDRAAVASRAFGQEQAIQIFELGGRTTSRAWVERFKDAVTEFQATGSAAGIGRSQLVFTSPIDALEPRLEKGALHFQMRTEKGATNHRVTLPLYEEQHADGSTDEIQREVRFGEMIAQVETEKHVPKLHIHWLVDTVRNVPWIGTAPIAWLEGKVFAARDWVKRSTFREAVASGEEPLEVTAAKVVRAQASADEVFPPPAITEFTFPNRESGEGEWKEPDVPWVRKTGPNGPPLFVKTFLRTDRERPYSKAIMVALDMRHMDLQMEAGTEDPKPLAGGAGPGRIPRDPKLLKRVVATFNGGFKTEHGFYGMMVRKRVLLPALPGVATVVLTDDGMIGMGTWGKAGKGMGILGLDESHVVSYRQNLEPLLDNGVYNPSKRSFWGFTLPEVGIQTERSGLCRTENGTLIYAWGDDINAPALAQAMKAAGCTYGMHLDMNPHHTGFSFTDVDELKGRKYKTQKLANEMEVPGERYLETTLKDFFYVMLRDPAPPPLASSPAAEATWTPSEGTQPPPSGIASVWSTQVVEDGVAVELTHLTRGRTRFLLRAGKNEFDKKHTPIESDLREEDEKEVLLAMGLGHAGSDKGEKRIERFLQVATKTITQAAPHEGSALLSILPSGELFLSAKAVEGASDVAAGTWLVERGEVRPFVRGPKRPVHAIGITGDGSVVLARGVTEDATIVGKAMLRAGVQGAALVERGHDRGHAWDRTGTASPPKVRYDETTLFVLGKRMPPRTFKFEWGKQ